MSACVGQASATPAPSAARPASALDGPGPHPDLISLARGALDCDWVATGFIAKCPGLLRWVDATRPPAGAPELMLRMLEDPDERIRWLGAVGLGVGLGLDRDQQNRVLAAAGRERSGAVAIELGALIGSLELAGEDQLAILEEMISRTPLVALRSGVAGRTLGRNPRSAAAIVLTTKLLGDRNDSVVLEGVRSLRGASVPAPAPTCAALGRLIHHTDGEISGASAVAAAKRRCTDQYDAILELYGTRLASPAQLISSDVDEAAAAICAEGPTDRQREASAKRLLSSAANPDLKSGVRAEALAAAGACLGDAGLARIKPFEKSEDAVVRLMAEKLTRAAEVRQRDQPKKQ